MREKLKKYRRQALEDWNFIFKSELRKIVRDQGVLVFFFLVPLAYPLLYTFIYTREVVREVPVVVVDDSHSTMSRDYLRRIDATAEVRIVDHCPDMLAAQRQVEQRNAYGIIYLPADFSKRLHTGRQVNVSIYCDMSGLLYYKALLTANTNVSLSLNARLKVNRSGNTTDRQDLITEHPIAYEEVSLYNPQNGFASFLIPAVLILILQQTLLLGVGIAAGTAREQNRFRELLPVSRHYSGLLRIVLGKAAAYLLVYIPLSVYVLGVVPRLFHLNQLGSAGNLVLFAIPYLLACIFFAMTVSALVRHRETCIMIIVFSSVPLLFISGVSWPVTAIPDFWRALAYIAPSTPGINGYLKLNNMGAPITDIQREWYLLWAQACFYFLTTCVVYRTAIRVSRQHFVERYRAMKRRKLAEEAGGDEKVPSM